MSKKEFEQRWARKFLREMLSAVEECVGKLEKSMEDTKESNNVLGENIDDLRKQSNDIVTMCLTSNRDSVQELLDSKRKKLTREEQYFRSHGDDFEGGNNGYDDDFKHKNRGARERAGLVPNNRGEKSVKYSTQ
ncbi:hypothetical protein Gogos_002930 [Gossypium gossypioides]|uniref:Uncharacterized protein n=1 Tax=Gossypium gossypioides TaxID=34282 RepID=A0A7J9CKT4_GOSGO|nr:hypothetical protein [Gossypium gossypioides]